MRLFSYQENAICSILSDPSHSQLISMPTGTGKTITFLSAIKRIGKNCLVLVHREELLKQTKEKALLMGFSEKDIACVTSEEKEELRPLTIAMVQTMKRNLGKYDPNYIQMCVVDEAHHARAFSYGEIFRHFRVFEDKKMLLGFTATPLRGDKKELGDIFISHSFKMTLTEATQNGYICPVHGIRINIIKSLENIENQSGDYDISKLDNVMNCEEVNNVVAERCEHLHKTPSIIFCTSIDHAKKIAALLRKKKRKAISISYKTSKSTLEKIFTRLKNNQIEFITNAVKLSEGFDHPPIQSIVLARPTRSPVLYKQMIGRGLRNYSGKHDCTVIEFTGNDPKMICWEDIDENCTFQSTSSAEKKSREEGKEFYRQRFATSKNIRIIDVRVSPFQFYECKIRRFCKYRKEYRYIPFSSGFLVGEILPNPLKAPRGLAGSVMKIYVCFWKETYKSFFLWDGGNYCHNATEKIGEVGSGFEVKTLERNMMMYADYQPDHLGKWYPSEEESATKKQLSFLKRPPFEKMSARKIEMFIEDYAIKQAIDRYWRDQPMKSLDAGDNGPKINSTTKIYQLDGAY